MQNWNALLEQLNWDDATRQERVLQHRLRERAAQYAQPKAILQDADESERFTGVIFHLGDERYALDVRMVRGVRTIEYLTRVPATPPFYRGVVNVRGQILSALDLRIFFGLSSTSTLHEMLIVQSNALSLAILTDRVDDVISIPRSEIEGVELRYAYGVTAARITVLDIEQILADERLIVGGKQ